MTGPYIVQLIMVPAPVAQPGQAQGIILSSSITGTQMRLRRQNPVIALSPVTSVQRSISMLRKYCVTTPNTQAQKKMNPAL